MKKDDPTKIIEASLGHKYSEIFKRLISQKLEKSDAIIFLQGDRLDRIATVISLYEKCFAKKIFITGNNILIGKGKRKEEEDISLLEIENYLVRKNIPKEAMIIDDKSLNTFDQAVNVIRIAKKKKWSKIIVVTSPYHLLRTYLTFVQQVLKQNWPGRVIMKEAKGLSWSVLPSGRKKTAIEILKTEINKIKKYKNDIASIEAGENYLFYRK